jgi:phosphate transport system substrate-binding protein
VAKNSASPYVLPTIAAGADGSYPISRDLYMYTAHQPTGAIADYLKWIRGPEGQKIVGELGFVPLKPEE